MSSAWGRYQHVVAPAPVNTGFLVIGGAGHLGASRSWPTGPRSGLWVPFEATLPGRHAVPVHGAARRDRPAERGPWPSTPPPMLAFLLLHRLARQEGSSHWVAERRDRREPLAARRRRRRWRRSPCSPARSIGPALPGADSLGHPQRPRPEQGQPAPGDDQPAGGHPLEAGRPVQRRGVHRRAPNARSYWRLTSLERFDGRIWSSSGSYGKAGTHLPEAQSTKVGHAAGRPDLHDRRRCRRSGSRAAYEARSFQGKGIDVRFDESSSTLIVDSSVATSDGLSYSVTSTSPRITPADLTGTSGQVPASIRRTVHAAAGRLQPAGSASWRPGRRARPPRPTRRPSPSRTTSAPSPTT